MYFTLKKGKSQILGGADKGEGFGSDKDMLMNFLGIFVMLIIFMAVILPMLVGYAKSELPGIFSGLDGFIAPILTVFVLAWLFVSGLNTKLGNIYVEVIPWGKVLKYSIIALYFSAIIFVLFKIIFV